MIGWAGILGFWFLIDAMPLEAVNSFLEQSYQEQIQDLRRELEQVRELLEHLLVLQEQGLHLPIERKAFAGLIYIKVSLLDKWRREEGLPYIQVGATVLIDPSEFVKWVQERKKKV